MSCEYCKNGKPFNKISNHENNTNALTLSMKIEDGYLVWDWSDGHKGKRKKINCCPMCGSKLGDSDD